MHRREFLAGAAVAAGLVGTTLASHAGESGEKTGEAQERAVEYYELRRYHLQMGAKPKLMDDFWREAALPALKRLGIGPVGVFNVLVGPDSPTLYVLITHKTAESVVTLPARLAEDAEYQKAGAAFLNAPHADPAYLRMESSLLVALSGMPKLEVPPAAAEQKPRLFELRTYKSHSQKASDIKADMFNNGEIPLFKQAGFHPVFFSQAIIGQDVPHIAYMISFEDLAAREKNFAAFGSNPEFRRLAALPKYADLLTSISNVILRPTAYSQI
jgi:hypothetical protein